MTTHIHHPGIGTSLGPFEERLAAAVEAYRSRQSGVSEPDGYWQRGVWVPSKQETRSCCRQHPATNQPHAVTSIPDSVRRHCRGHRHVAALFGVPPKALRDAVRRA